MNFLDAHKILYDYINTLNSAAVVDGVLRRRSVLKNTKKEILDSYKLFLAHMYFYQTRTQQEYEELQARINLLPSFTEDDNVNQYLECKTIVEDKSIVGRIKNKTALPFAKEKMQKIFAEANQALIDFYSSEESKDLDRFTSQIAKAASDARSALNDKNLDNDSWWERYMNIKDDYCSKAYACAGIPEDYYSIDFFYTFDRLKYLANHPEVADFYAPYKEYIFSHR